MGSARTGVLLLTMLLGAQCLMPPPASAQQREQASASKRTAAMSERIYRRLQKIQELTADKQYQPAEAALAKLQSADKLSAYERAQVWNLTAYVAYLQENYDAAIRAYRQVLEQGSIPAALRHSTLKTLSQLYFARGDYRRALTTVTQLLSRLPEPGADLYMLQGQAYFQLQQYRQALPPVERAVALYRTQGKPPPENWLLLLRVIHHELGDYPNMLVVLKELISLYPRDRYLLTLAGVYGELEQTRKQLAVLEVLYEQASLQEGTAIVNLANLYLLHRIPYKAARLLQHEMDAGRVAESEKNLRLLAQAWYLAREDERALAPLQAAAEKSSDGQLYIRLAQAYVNLERWREAGLAVRAGLRRGGLQRVDTANVMLGMALFNQQLFEQARAAFQSARADPRSRDAAEQWLSYIDSELQRLEAMRQVAPRKDRS